MGRRNAKADFNRFLICVLKSVLNISWIDEVLTIDPERGKRRAHRRNIQTIMVGQVVWQIVLVLAKRNVWQYFLRIWLLENDVEIPIRDDVVRDDCHDGVVA